MHAPGLRKVIIYGDLLTALRVHICQLKMGKLLVYRSLLFVLLLPNTINVIFYSQIPPYTKQKLY